MDFPGYFQETRQKKAPEEHRAWWLKSLAKALLVRSPNRLGFSQEIKMREIKGSAQGHSQWRFPSPPGFPGSCCSEEPSISPPNLNSVNTTARQPPPSCGQNRVVTLAEVNYQPDSLRLGDRPLGMPVGLTLILSINMGDPRSLLWDLISHLN